MPTPPSCSLSGPSASGGFTIARRTLATVGDDITDLPILAALVVSTVGATTITVLSWLGIPASLAVSTTSCIIGLDWGRASRAKTLAEMATPPVAPDPTEPTEPRPEFTTGALAAPPTEDPDDGSASPTVGELAEGEGPDTDAEGVADGGVPKIGEEEAEAIPAESLFDPAATARIVVMWVLSPTLSVVGAYALFSVVG